jgi:hypothetical protein
VEFSSYLQDQRSEAPLKDNRHGSYNKGSMALFLLIFDFVVIAMNHIMSDSNFYFMFFSSCLSPIFVPIPP